MNPAVTPAISLNHQIPEPAPARSKEIEKKRFAFKRPNLGQLLRWSGSVLLVASAIAFMFQGVYTFAPMTRHWIILAICAFLGTVGVYTGTALKEDKGARLFLGFAAASFPVLASQLGAMLFSIFGAPPQTMPQPLVFTLGNVSKVAAIGALTLAVIIPMSYLAFRVLARSQATLITGLYTAANLLVLIPLRSSYAMTMLITSMFLTIIWWDHIRLSRDFRLDNFEGYISRTLLFTPILVILGRACFYTMNTAFYGFMLILLSGCLAFHWCNLIKSDKIKTICQLSGQIGIAAGWAICVMPMMDSYFLGKGLAVNLLLLPIALFLAGQSFISQGNAAVRYRFTAAFVCQISIVFAHWLQPSPMVSVAALATALLVMVLGTVHADKPVLILGGAGAAIGLGNFAIQAFRLQNSYAWAALAMIGIGAMLGASLIETKRKWLLNKGTSLWGKLDNNSSD